MMDEEIRGTVNTAEEKADGEVQPEQGFSFVVSPKAPETEAVETAAAEAEYQPETQPADDQQDVNRQDVWRHPEDSPYSPLYIPDQKKNNRITIALIAVLVICLIGGLIFAVSKLVESAMNEISTEASAWEETFSDWKDDLEADKEADKEAKEADKEDDSEDSDDSSDDGDTFWDDDWSAQGIYDEYTPSEDDEYYVEIVDSVRNDLSYSVDKEYYTYDDAADNVEIWVDYYFVEGTGFDDKINEALEEGAMYYAKTFGADEGVSDFYLLVESYVTYMDEDILSVVVWEEYLWGDEAQADLYCMNFDMNTGALLYNTEIIDPSSEMIDEFRYMNDYQNGYIEYVDECSDEELMEHFTDESSLILFYTPVGLEIGFNYDYGWVTATLKDYEQYLNRL